jgi:hypothetical protein
MTIPPLPRIGDVAQLNPNAGPFGALLGIILDITNTGLTIAVYAPQGYGEPVSMTRFVVPHGYYKIIGPAAWVGLSADSAGALPLPINPTDN